MDKQYEVYLFFGREQKQVTTEVDYSKIQGFKDSKIQRFKGWVCVCQFLFGSERSGRRQRDWLFFRGVIQLLAP